MKKLFVGIGRTCFPFRIPKRMVGWEQLKESFNSFVRDPAKAALEKHRHLGISFKECLNYATWGIKR